MIPVNYRFHERIAVGTHSEITHPNAIKAALAEFISTLIFVFAGTGTAMSVSKMIFNNTPQSLIAVALAYGFALFVAVSISANISGGHVNPAVTVGACLGGHITVLRGILFVIGQLLGSVVACLLLLFVTDGTAPVAPSVSEESVWTAFVFEIVMTFGLVYTVFATALDPKKGELGTIAPIAIGLIVAANILAGGSFEGAAMNPAVAFGPAVVSGSWANHWIYWAGPLIGGALAAIVYELFFMSHNTHQPLPQM
ncbi:hypothetical protein NMG60_11000641 [Bertholletia excelsa]